MGLKLVLKQSGLSIVLNWNFGLYFETLSIMKIFFRLSKCESRQYEKRDNFFVEILDLKYIYSNLVKYEYQILIIGISKKKNCVVPAFRIAF